MIEYLTTEQDYPSAALLADLRNLTKIDGYRVISRLKTKKSWQSTAFPFDPSLTANQFETINSLLAGVPLAEKKRLANKFGALILDILTSSQASLLIQKVLKERSEAKPT